MAGKFCSLPSRKPAKDFEVEVVGSEIGLGRPVRSVQLFCSGWIGSWEVGSASI